MRRSRKWAAQRRARARNAEAMRQRRIAHALFMLDVAQADLERLLRNWSARG